jgi:hypothetical protein
MPTSEFGHVSPIIHEVKRLNPLGIVDLGIGCGKYGALCREALDFTYGRFDKGKWNTRIVGVEGFEAYRNSMWELYNTVVIADFAQQENYSAIVGWDLILAIDCLEHLEREKAFEVLDYLVKNNKRVIVSVPLGHCPQDAVFGNEYERHRSVWGYNDFSKYAYKSLVLGGVGMVVLIKGGV